MENNESKTTVVSTNIQKSNLDKINIDFHKCREVLINSGLIDAAKMIQISIDDAKKKIDDLQKKYDNLSEEIKNTFRERIDILKEMFDSAKKIVDNEKMDLETRNIFFDKMGDLNIKIECVLKELKEYTVEEKNKSEDKLKTENDKLKKKNDLYKGVIITGGIIGASKLAYDNIPQVKNAIKSLIKIFKK